MTKARVLEGSRILDDWYVAATCPAKTEWVVAHYVGGEEFEVVDDYYYTKLEAEQAQARLNAEAREHLYYRDWEGDEL